MQTYHITKENKKIFITVERTLISGNTQQYLSDFSKIMEGVNPHEYELFIDGTKYIITSLEMQDTLKMHLTHFKELGFKKITIKIGNNVVLKLQVSRIAKYAGLEDVEIL